MQSVTDAQQADLTDRLCGYLCKRPRCGNKYQRVPLIIRPSKHGLIFLFLTAGQ